MSRSYLIICAVMLIATILLASTCLSQSASYTSPQSVVQADTLKGQDAGEKIARCLAALPPTGGVCDARNLAGDQYSASGFTVGDGSRPMQLLLGVTTLIVTKPIIVQ